MNVREKERKNSTIFEIAFDNILFIRRETEYRTATTQCIHISAINCLMFKRCSSICALRLNVEAINFAVASICIWMFM